MNLINRKKLLLIFLLVFPLASYANGGGPLLLCISGSVFLYGQVWILASETFIYCKCTDLDPVTAFKQVFLVNLGSTIVVGLGFSFILAIVTALAMSLPEPFKDYASLMGTWAYEGAPHTNLLGPLSLIWLTVTFILTIIYERWHLSKLWLKANYQGPITISGLMVRAHVVSYTGLLLMSIYMWGGMIGALLGM